MDRLSIFYSIQIVGKKKYFLLSLKKRENERFRILDREFYQVNQLRMYNVLCLWWEELMNVSLAHNPFNYDIPAIK